MGRYFSEENSRYDDMLNLVFVALQDNQCGIVTNIDIECAVKLVGTNCVLYPVNSKNLQHIWVRA